MNCQKKASFTIKGSRLLPCRENHFNFHLNQVHFQIIQGTVYCLNQTPCAGAAIQVTQVDMVNHSTSLLGYTITDESGHYVLSLEAHPDKRYELTVFTPLITDSRGDLT
ncbi:carboxypeptidase regulatory-like domain-containing protein [Lacrimispora amygdalina]|uniref:carboxypeptidase regulatory-like domain-containing protein n=1 Tax=Lacrimispora amygdalina TaxID=253257 RepID=UPI000BE35EC6|nr:carboxypeptidase regulatory-like domain-containing protein [Lacrimispora amygdalina]